MRIFTCSFEVSGAPHVVVGGRTYVDSAVAGVPPGCCMFLKFFSPANMPCFFGNQCNVAPAACILLFGTEIFGMPQRTIAPPGLRNLPGLLAIVSIRFVPQCTSIFCLGWVVQSMSALSPPPEFWLCSHIHCCLSRSQFTIVCACGLRPCCDMGFHLSSFCWLDCLGMIIWVHSSSISVLLALFREVNVSQDLRNCPRVLASSVTVLLCRFHTQQVTSRTTVASKLRSPVFAICFILVHRYQLHMC